MDILSMDVETSDLKANFGDVICICAKPYKKNKIYTYRIDDSKYNDPNQRIWTDEKLILDFCELVREQVIVIGHNIARFDLKFLNTRLSKWKRPLLNPRINFVDTLTIARRRLSLSNYKLETVADHYGVPDPKTPLVPSIWNMAAKGSIKDIDFVVEHCKKDVQTEEQVYQAMLKDGFIEVRITR